MTEEFLYGKLLLTFKSSVSGKWFYIIEFPGSVVGVSQSDGTSTPELLDKDDLETISDALLSLAGHIASTIKTPQKWEEESNDIN